MSKHTPGPWAIEQDGPWTLVRGYDVELQSEDYPGPLVCTPADNGSTQANARLIAAAPDLLAALLEISRCCDERASFDGDPAMKRWCAATSEVARAAIAKAEGAS